MVHSTFKHMLARGYESVKVQYPTEGRRKWRLRVLYDSWSMLGSDVRNVDTSNGGVSSFDTDPDPLDQDIDDDELGIIIRTDFSNEEAWSNFCKKVTDSQKDLISEMTKVDPENPSENTAEGSSDVTMKDGPAETATAAVEDGSDSSDESPEFMKILNPTDEADKRRLSNISNLTALRLFNDVDIRAAPDPPAGTKRVNPPNPLIDQGGWQEIYSGKNLWIYDARSNVDECVRVVGQAGDFYGTATGDSWRARASHICELQFNMSYQGLKIDFNGLDRWDWEERVRNLKETASL
ncbi:hypothetical protein B0H34DRAFT_698791 [Crassisporium funariophilum]|nr:hypothetical protein B0H34DRAFT_698791 [Crassisporium funariophilum]